MQRRSGEGSRRAWALPCLAARLVACGGGSSVCSPVHSSEPGAVERAAERAAVALAASHPFCKHQLRCAACDGGFELCLTCRLSQGDGDAVAAAIEAWRPSVLFLDFDLTLCSTRGGANPLAGAHSIDAELFAACVQLCEATGSDAAPRGDAQSAHGRDPAVPRRAGCPSARCTRRPAESPRRSTCNRCSPTVSAPSSSTIRLPRSARRACGPMRASSACSLRGKTITLSEPLEKSCVLTRRRGQTVTTKVNFTIPCALPNFNIPPPIHVHIPSHPEGKKNSRSAWSSSPHEYVMRDERRRSDAVARRLASRHQ